MRKLSDDIMFKLTWLGLEELQELLKKLNSNYNNTDRFNVLKHMGQFYGDEQIIPLLRPDKEYKKSNSFEILEDLKKCYVKDNIDNSCEKIVNKRGRKKLFEKTLKEKVFELLDVAILDYNGVLSAGIINISENTFKTILSQYRTAKGIKVKRGRKVKNND